jgi:hypothetical protein
MVRHCATTRVQRLNGEWRNTLIARARNVHGFLTSLPLLSLNWANGPYLGVQVSVRWDIHIAYLGLVILNGS